MVIEGRVAFTKYQDWRYYEEKVLRQPENYGARVVMKPNSDADYLIVVTRPTPTMQYRRQPFSSVE